MNRDASDEALVRAYLDGSDDAFAALAERYERPLLGLARALLGRSDLAVDAVQDTWLRALRGMQRFKGDSTVKTWLYRILINRCHDVRRGTRAAQSLLRAAGERAAAMPESPPEPAELATLRGAVQQLGVREREIVLLCYHAGMTHSEAAAILGVPPGTLKSRLHAALTELRSRLLAEVRP